jgi:hypothetical protein
MDKDAFISCQGHFSSSTPIEIHYSIMGINEIRVLYRSIRDLRQIVI